MTFDAFRQLAEAQRAAGTERFVIPVARRLSADLLTPVLAFLALRQGHAHAFLLESVEGGEKLARYSFLGHDPYAVVTARGADVDITRRRPVGFAAADTEPSGDIFATLQQLIGMYDEVRRPGLPRLTGGAVGYLGYDAVRLLERLPDAPTDDLGLPDAVWCFYDRLAAFDHVRHQLVLLASAFVDSATDLRAAHAAAFDALGRLEADLGRSAPRPAPVTLPSDAVQSNTERANFEAAVERSKEHIYEGDIFQVVLSQRFSMPFGGDGFNLYRALRQVNPSPYLFYLDFDGFALAGSSPEVLVRAEWPADGPGRAEVLPIAGTRPRGADEEEDARLAEELQADAKERAEHLMLVDLGRNDLGRVCRYGSVEVDRYATVERYSHVMHLVSSVAGAIDDKAGPLDVLAACFPAGTVSGAPKVRAMELIDALEPARRGVYAGAVGYLDFSGTLDTCIAIRTMLIQDNTVYVQAGAGIVADSNPTAEYEETRSKARALLEAMRVAAEELL